MMTDQFKFDNPIMPGSIWDKESDYFVPVVSTVGNGPKGDKGDPTFFKDLTDSEKAEIFRSVSFVGNEIVDAFYTTTENSTATIPIPIPNYDEYDLLWVFVEGLFLLENLDYAIFNGNIILNSPITHNNTRVLFRALRFNTPDGNKNLNVEQNTTQEYTVNYNAKAIVDTETNPDFNADYVGQTYISETDNSVWVAKTINGDWIKLN